jgi:sec-independent protein translocase protein TatB
VSGFSLTEIVMIGIVALVAVGPKRLPGMLRSFGNWVRKLRKMTTEVRAQTGIDDVLRAEGLQGGISELRSLMRGGHAPAAQPYRPAEDPYRQLEFDVEREYPPEGPDAKGALPDDLAADAPDPEAEALAAAKADPVVTVSEEEASEPLHEAVAPTPAAVADPAPPESPEPAAPSAPTEPKTAS